MKGILNFQRSVLFITTISNLQTMPFINTNIFSLKIQYTKFKHPLDDPD